MAAQGIQAAVLAIDKFTKRVTAPPGKQIMEQLAVEAKAMIDRRTAVGKDAEGKKFAPYSPGYSAAKARSISSRRGKRQKTRAGKSGLGRYGLGAGRMIVVDLTASGRMMSSLASHALDVATSEVYFSASSEAQKAYWHQTGAGKLPIRRFMGLSKKEREALGRSCLEKLAKRHGGTVR
jgi:hypothetical protein